MGSSTVHVIGGDISDDVDVSTAILGVKRFSLLKAIYHFQFTSLFGLCTFQRLLWCSSFVSSFVNMGSLSSARKSAQHITFFGDQTVDTLLCIKDLTSQSHRLPILRQYLREAADKLQLLLSRIELGDYESYRNFETIVELAEIYSKQDGTYEPIGCALWTISQFADYLRYIPFFIYIYIYTSFNVPSSRSETDPSILTLSDSAAQPTYVVGVCGGLLLGAAAATAQDINELLDIGRKLVDVSFNLGVAQWKRAMDIEGKPGRWAVAIVNVPPKQIGNIITAFNEDMVSKNFNVVTKRENMR